MDQKKFRVVKDFEDQNDYIYTPTLKILKEKILPPKNLNILSQEGNSCTGYALAATINFLNKENSNKLPVSGDMIYEFAKTFDEWIGEDYNGSSCRGAIKALKNMGVCSQESWEKSGGIFSKDQLLDAKKNKLGAYYRINLKLEDFHCALNETGVIFVSSYIHEGWKKVDTKDGKIPFKKSNKIDSHAFAIVGYDETGFYIQNSWGKKWGNEGLGHWSYEDFMENILDAWVLQMGVSTNAIDSKINLKSSNLKTGYSPDSNEIWGHYVNIDDGEFVTKDKYPSRYEDLKTTMSIIEKSLYKHVVIYAHGGLNTKKDCAVRTKAMLKTFKENGIYPINIMYNTGVVEELKDSFLRVDEDSKKTSYFGEEVVNSCLEKATKSIGRALWREMKNGARVMFENEKAGVKVIDEIVKLYELKKIKIHIVGHSTGAILLMHLLDYLSNSKKPIEITSCSLMAPAAKMSDFDKYYEPILNGVSSVKIKNMCIYSLNDKLEKDDNVGLVYRSSLLYLVSNSYEDKNPEKLLGMEIYNKNLKNQPNFEIIYSGKKEYQDRCKSKSHGGFDNDPFTMNDILKRILETKDIPESKFDSKNLDY
ncbi:hypothetical protein [Candidatus Cetobacterium colombiensis]|uniref:Peptidase C1A papain C-terminal domain-containing protein n=1 Tax=Candidatus Cetobacterium colombiensis TaxID=3073100 RepID=A0ABU4WBR4_9FUSO|nr:hypothetical protein [Candidatus Cetobacterium colombiensis]MDX8336590.1 hypothetical protein [Candidatus Cetobacterium colombiensis]